MLNVQPIASKIAPNLKKSAQCFAEKSKAKKIALPVEFAYAKHSKKALVTENSKKVKCNVKTNYDYCGSVELMCVPLLSF